ncbi:hypothetical protein DFQ28_009334 [Apophysomyces sp. BC1034]|nr:hypothetical protein DFQ28_009334 [Apophysomyces sp. BC1034]
MHRVIPPATLVIASRESRLALWQAEHVGNTLHKLYPSCDVKILGMTTRGDQILDRALSKVGGKGLFVKELESALSDGRADLAVHSLKDVPMTLPDGFALPVILTREDPCDAFVSPRFASLEQLPDGAVVGTSSLRREAMLRSRYPHLVVKPLRGNLDTRLVKLDRGDYSAIILAVAGLKRLGLAARIRSRLDPTDCLPAAGQGALGIEIRASRTDLHAWLAPLHDVRTALAVEAERAVSRALGGSCEVPLAAHAQWHGDVLRLRGLVATPDGTRVLAAHGSAMPVDAAAARALGLRVAHDLQARGAMDIVRALLDASLPAAAGSGNPVATRPTVVITRAAGQRDELLATLAAAGFEGFEFPLIDIAGTEDTAPLVDALLGLERYALVVFVSPNAVECAFATLATACSDAPMPDAATADASPRVFSWPAAVPVAVVGPGTVRALARHGVQPHTHRIIAPGDAVHAALQAPAADGGKAGAANASSAGEPPRPDDTPAMQVSSDSYSSAAAPPRYDSEALVGALEVAFAPDGLTVLRGRRVLLVRGDGGRELLADTLRAHGAVVDTVGAYQRRLPEPSVDAWQRVHALLADHAHAWVLTSSEGVRNLEELAREHLNRDEIVALKRVPIVTPHPRIGETARKAGFDTITVSGAGDQAIVHALRAVLSPVTQAASSPKTELQSAQSRMTDSKDSQPASGAAPQPARPAAASAPPNVPFTPHEAKPRRCSVGTALAWIVAVVVLAGAGAGGYVLERKIARLQHQLAARQQASDALTHDTRLKTDEAANAVRQLDSQLAQLTVRVGDMQTQQQALQASLQGLAQNRDDWTLAEAEQAISAASQQLQLTGNVSLALFVLQSVDTRLAASSGPQVIAVRKALAQDIDKLKAAPSVDLAGLAIKLDDVIAHVDALPLAGETPAVPVKPHAGAPADTAKVAAANGEPRWKAWWHTFAGGVTRQLTRLVQVRRIDNADAMLVAPDQGYLLRENVKLRLLSARISLLSRDEKLMGADLQAAQRALARYFDPSAQATRNACELLDEVRKGAEHVELPNLDTSLNAIHQNKSRG